jgi:hypothetical protein
MTFIIEYKTRGYKYTTEIKANSQIEALKIFMEKYPNGKILSIKKNEI